MLLSGIGQDTQPLVGTAANPPVTRRPDVLVHADTRPDPDQFRNDLGSLFGAVKAGDIRGAQQALAAVQADQSPFYSNQPAGQSPGTGSAFTTDFQTLIGAVQSGDAAGAQKALQSLQSDLQARAGRGAHHHHHHHQVAPNIDPATDATGTIDTGSPTTQPPVNL
jgi:hypothetical protein